jgi:hypothetical protein
MLKEKITLDTIVNRNNYLRENDFPELPKDFMNTTLTVAADASHQPLLDTAKDNWQLPFPSVGRQQDRNRPLQHIFLAACEANRLRSAIAEPSMHSSAPARLNVCKRHPGQ